MFRRHPVLTAVTLAYLAFVAWVTLNPDPPQPSDNALFLRALEFFARHDATAWLTYSRLEFLANVAMFVPIGVFLLLLLGRSWWFMAVLFGVATTFTIEFIQLGLPNRVPDPRDVVANSAGAAIGVVAALVITTPAALRARRAERVRRASEHERVARLAAR